MTPKLIAAVLAGLLGSLTAAQTANAAANSPLIVWQGGAEITALTSPGCDNLGFSVGDLLHSVYRPNLDPAEPQTALTFISGRSASIYFRSTGNAFMATGTGTYNGNHFSGRATSASGGYSGNWNLKITPATFTSATTSAVTIAGTLSNFYNTAGCTVTFKGAYQRRP